MLWHATQLMGSFAHGFDLQDPVCFSAPRQCNMHRPHLDFKQFPAWRLSGWGSSCLMGELTKMQAQASSPCASLCQASLGISSDAWWRSAPVVQSSGGAHYGLGTADLLKCFPCSGCHKLSPKGRPRDDALPFRQHKEGIFTPCGNSVVYFERFLFPRGLKNKTKPSAFASTSQKL